MNFDLENLSSFAGWERLAETGMAFGTNLIAALAIFLIGKWIASRLVILMKAALTRAKVDRTLVSFLGNVANIGLLILIIIAALGKLGIPTTSVTALIGGAGLAVALSLKDQLSNFAAGALIILFRPFKVGDFIKVNGFEGTVSEIKMVQTALSTPDNEEVILPNSIVMSNCIVNRSSMPLCRVQVVVGVDYGCDLKAAKAAVLKGAKQPELAAKLVSWLQSGEVQKALPAEMWVYPAVKNTPLPKVFEFAQTPKHSDSPNRADINTKQKQWVSRWSKTVLR